MHFFKHLQNLGSLCCGQYKLLLFSCWRIDTSVHGMNSMVCIQPVGAVLSKAPVVGLCLAVLLCALLMP